MVVSKPHDPQAYARFRRCVWDEFIIPHQLLASTPEQSSRYLLDFNRPKSEPPPEAALAPRRLSTTARAAGRFLERLRKIKQRIRKKKARSTSPGKEELKKQDTRGEDTDGRPSMVESDSMEGAAHSDKTSKAGPTPLTRLESLPAEMLREIFFHTRDPYSMVYLALTSRHLLRVASGIKTTSSLKHECIDGSLSHHRRYHNYSHSNRQIQPVPRDRILHFLSLVGPIGDRRFSHICVNCLKWKTADYKNSTDRAKRFGTTRELIVQGVRKKDITPEAYVVMWMSRPEFVDMFCPECIPAKRKADKDRDDAVEENKQSELVNAAKGKRYRSPGRRPGPSWQRV
ncbi:hypothetical protein MKZ38_009083 [Zalerion maritima]|uniref:F-box domain-containing protein n=1 Tax=Zalerion maritima TaxID=339359 RepID=A0AAD5WMF7_9PEZI|nr:hypothetical protein MKZ38_009083 [Zalerion maritima]